MRFNNQNRQCLKCRPQFFVAARRPPALISSSRRGVYPNLRRSGLGSLALRPVRTSMVSRISARRKGKAALSRSESAFQTPTNSAALHCQVFWSPNKFLPPLGLSANCWQRILERIERIFGETWISKSVGRVGRRPRVLKTRATRPHDFQTPNPNGYRSYSSKFIRGVAGKKHNCLISI